MRGGGGSTWGVIVSITIKLHYIPEGGLTLTLKTWNGDICTKGKEELNDFIDNFIEWS